MTLPLLFFATRWNHLNQHFIHISRLNSEVIIMNMQHDKMTGTTNAGTVEKRVETVDHRSSPGQDQEIRRVEVVHVPHPAGENSIESPLGNRQSSGSLLTNAAAAAASAVQTAREALSGESTTSRNSK